MGNPDELARAIVFLASDDSSFITRAELFVGRHRTDLSPPVKPRGWLDSKRQSPHHAGSVTDGR